MTSDCPDSLAVVAASIITNIRLHETLESVLEPTGLGGIKDSPTRNYRTVGPAHVSCYEWLLLYCLFGECRS